MAKVATPLHSPGLTPAASPGMTPAASPLPGVSPREDAGKDAVTPLMPLLATPADSPKAYTPAASPIGRTLPEAPSKAYTPAASPAASPKAYTPAASPTEGSPRGAPLGPAMSSKSTASGASADVEKTPSGGSVPIPKKLASSASQGAPGRNTIRSKQKMAQSWAKEKAKISHRRQANNFRLKALDSISLEDMTHNDVHVTRRDIFRQVLAKQERNTNGCMSMPVNIIFFIVYALAVRMHEDIINVWLVESSIRNLFLPDITQLETVEDVWDWLETDFVNDLFVQSDFYGQPLPPEEWSRVQLYSQVQGSVLLTQSRDNLEPWGKVVQVNDLDSSVKDLYESDAGFVPRSSTQTFSSRRLAFTRPHMRQSLPGSSDDDATYDFALYPTEPQHQISADLNYLKQRRWLDEDTKRLTIKTLLLNNEFGRPRVEQLIIHLAFSRGGGVYGEMFLQSLFLKAHDNIMSVGIDVIWLLMLIAKTMDDSREVWMAFTLSTLKSHCTSGVTILDWIIIVCGWANVGGFALQVSQLTHFIDGLEKVIQLPLGAAGAGHASAEQQQNSEQLHRDADNLILVMEYWRMNLAWYTIILIFRFFAAFRSQPRLAVVTNTLTATFIDLVHFLLVFMPMLFAYAVSGNLLFGRRIEGFSTLQASLGVCLRIVFENEYEWLLLSEEYFATTAIWVWSFLIVVVLVMLNLVLAVMLDIYNEVRSNTNSADTIFLSMRNVVHRIYNFAQWVDDKDLQCVLIDMDDHSTLSLTDLCEALPSLTPVQRDMLFDACRVEMAWQAKQDVRKHEFLKLAASIKLSIDHANGVLEDVTDEQEHQLSDMGLPPIKEMPSMREARMQGLSRPFPGMPGVPGGHMPPILGPTKDCPGIHVPPLDLPPEMLPDWYFEMKQALSTQCDMMEGIKYEVESLQWIWYQLNEMYRPNIPPHPELEQEPANRNSAGGRWKRVSQRSGQ